MADLRCPMCSKLNPDTLDVCQHCGARITPLRRPPADSPERPAGRGQPPARPTKDDDWLNRLRGREGAAGAASDSAQPAEPDPASEPPADEWLAQLRADQSAPDGDLPEEEAEGEEWQPRNTDFLRSRLGDYVPSQPAAQEGSEADQPEWLQSLEGETPSAEASTAETIVHSGSRPSPQAEPPAPAAESDLPDWLASLDDGTKAKAPAPSGRGAAAPRMPQRSTAGDSAEPPDAGRGKERAEAPEGSPAPKPSGAERGAVGSTDWLKRQLGMEGSAPEAPEGKRSSVVGSTEWLKSLGSGQEAAPEAPGQPAVGGVTGWLESLAPGEEAAPEAPEKAHGEPAVGGVTGWLDSLKAEGEAEPEAPGEAAAGPRPAWDMRTQRLEMPSSLEGESAAPKPSEAGRGAVGSTDWLKRQLGMEGQAPEASEEAHGEPAIGGVTGWLESLKAEGEAEPEPEAPSEAAAAWAKPEGDADQTEVPRPSDRAPATPPPGDAPRGAGAVGSTDWLKRQLGMEGQAPEAPAAKSTRAAIIGSTDWLKSLEPGQEAPAAAGTKGVTGWLESLQGDSKAEAEAPEGAATGQGPSWDIGTQRLELPPDLEAGAPEPEAAAPEAPGRAGPKGVTGWLESLQADGEAEPAAPDEAAADKRPEWDTRTQRLEMPPSLEAKPDAPKKAEVGRGPGAVGSTDWLKQHLAGERQAPAAPAAKRPGGAIIGSTDWLRSLGAGPAPTPEPPPAEKSKGVTGWLESLDSGPAPAEPPDEMPRGPAVVGMTDWLNELTGDQPAPTSGAELSDATSSPGGTGEDWLSSLRSQDDTVQASRLGQSAPAFYMGSEDETRVSPGAKAPDSDLPSWLAAMRPTGLDVPPIEAEAEPPLAEGEVSDLQEPSPADAVAADDAAGTTALPPTTRRAAEPTARRRYVVPRPKGDSADAAREVVPAWLQALRPLDLPAPDASTEAQREETAGPLAGMRGVLAAESVVSVSGKPGGVVARFAVSDMHTRQADLFRTIMREEMAEAEPRPHRKFQLRYAFDRLAIALTLLAVLLVPYLAGGFVPTDLLPGPSALPAAGQNVFSAIQNLPLDRPVLVAVEYVPAAAAELNPGVEAVLIHLMKRGLRVAVVSTFPSGAGVARGVLERAAIAAGYTADDYGVHYIHLGYLPGGAAGLQQFAYDPRESITRDFRDGQGDPWSREALGGLNTAGDFGLIVVATASADAAQAWIEQVQPAIRSVRPDDGARLAAITSAAAEPLVYPFSQGEPQQLLGFVSGFSGAMAYSQALAAAGIADEPADHTSRWLAMALGLYTTAAALAVGLTIGGAVIVRDRFAQKTTGALRGKGRAAATTRTTKSNGRPSKKPKAAKAKTRAKAEVEKFETESNP